MQNWETEETEKIGYYLNLLEIKENNIDERKIKLAHHKISLTFHPDKINKKNLNENEIRKINDKACEINNARVFLIDNIASVRVYIQRILSDGGPEKMQIEELRWKVKNLRSILNLKSLALSEKSKRLESFQGAFVIAFIIILVSWFSLILKFRNSTLSKKFISRITIYIFASLLGCLFSSPIPFMILFLLSVFEILFLIIRKVVTFFRGTRKTQEDKNNASVEC